MNFTTLYSNGSDLFKTVVTFRKGLVIVLKKCEVSMGYKNYEI